MLKNSRDNQGLALSAVLNICQSIQRSDILYTKNWIQFVVDSIHVTQTLYNNKCAALGKLVLFPDIVKCNYVKKLTIGKWTLRLAIPLA